MVVMATDKGELRTLAHKTAIIDGPLLATTSTKPPITPTSFLLMNIRGLLQKNSKCKTEHLKNLSACNQALCIALDLSFWNVLHSSGTSFLEIILSYTRPLIFGAEGFRGLMVDL
ncbi:Hypothetical predicted protein [Octopus vulgaris]|uniref:Uncharacterized protein n=1 Tax=Octopus vulgaris TaxID=6645 RepID=A0AA36BQD8_OCTVU|nr:Hypothetical predicted protein [Octopus vulgaris]